MSDHKVPNTGGKSASEGSKQRGAGEGWDEGERKRRKMKKGRDRRISRRASIRVSRSAKAPSSHYLCPQCRDINLLRLNAHGSPVSTSVRRAPVRRTTGDHEVKEKEEEEEEGAERYTRHDRTLLHLAHRVVVVVVRSLQSRATCPGISQGQVASADSSRSPSAFSEHETDETLPNELISVRCF